MIAPNGRQRFPEASGMGPSRCSIEDPLFVFFCPLRVRRDRQYKVIRACEMVDEGTIGGLLCAGCTCVQSTYTHIHPCLLLLQTRQAGRKAGGEKGRRETERETYRLPKTATRLVCRPLYCTAPMLVLVRAGEWALVWGSEPVVIRIVSRDCKEAPEWLV